MQGEQLVQLVTSERRAINGVVKNAGFQMAVARCSEDLTAEDLKKALKLGYLTIALMPEEPVEPEQKPRNRKGRARN